MIKDIYEVVKEAMEDTGKFYISEEIIIHLIGIYGLNRLLASNLLTPHTLPNGMAIYSLKPFQGDDK